MAVARTPRRGDHGPVLSATKARSGRRGLHVLWILIISTGLAAIGLLALLAVDGPSLSGPGGQVKTDRPTISVPQSPVKQNAAG